MGAGRDIALLARRWRWARRSLLPHSAIPHAPPAQPREFPTEWARTPAGQVARAGVQQGGFKPVLWTQTRPEVYGREHLDGLEAPAIFVANHSSHLDAPLMLCSLPPGWARQVAVGAAADYFFDARWRASLTALAFNAFPVERRGGARVTGTAKRLLGEGWSLLLFPEGTRSSDGWMQDFRSGPARLCCGGGVPAVPVALRGTYRAMPRGRHWPGPGRPRVVVRFGRPLRPEQGEGPSAFSERLTEGIARLWDEEETTWWEAQRRDRTELLAGTAGPDAPRWRRTWESTRPGRNSAPNSFRAWPE